MLIWHHFFPRGQIRASRVVGPSLFTRRRPTLWRRSRRCGTPPRPGALYDRRCTVLSRGLCYLRGSADP